MKQGSDNSKHKKYLGQLDVSSYLPSLKVLTLVMMIVLLLLALYLPLNGKATWLWSSGPLSNAHKMIETDCKSCHADLFHPVQDKECKACHVMTEHAENLRQVISHHPEVEKRCAECHMDHNGDAGINLTDSRQCTECHAQIKNLSPDKNQLAVKSFEEHPEFRIRVPFSDPKGEFVNLNEPAKLKDTTPIKLNHALHLKENLNGKDGPVTLNCNSCHTLSSDYKTIKPITFENNCQSCHSLGFDERLPDSQVVHGDSEAVFPALFTAYSKLLLSGESGTTEEDQRARPGAQTLTSDSQKLVNLSQVVSASRDAEKELFTRTACFLCHDSSFKPLPQQNDSNSHYIVTKPHIPESWFTSARFNHGAHEEISCESCHTKTRESKKTEDVLLPKIETCQNCHSEKPRLGFVKSDCVLCHSYHDSLPRNTWDKREIQDYIGKLSRG